MLLENDSSLIEECKHCDAMVTGNFCSNCGHPLNHERIRLRGLLNDIISTFTYLEKGFVRVVRQLALRPGTMQKNYLAGYRGNYQKPFPMFVICGTICAFVLFLTNNSLNSQEQYFMRNYYVLLQTAMLPIYALLTWLLFFSSKLYYAEVLLLVVYMTGFMFLIVMPINVFYFFFGRQVISIVELVALAGYNTWTFLNFFKGKPKWLVLLKSLLSILICYMLFQFAAETIIGYIKIEKD